MDDRVLGDYVEHALAYFETQAANTDARVFSDAFVRELVVRLIRALYANNVLLVRGVAPTLTAGVGLDWVGLFWTAIAPSSDVFSVRVRDDGTMVAVVDDGEFPASPQLFIQMLKLRVSVDERRGISYITPFRRDVD